MQNYIRVKTLKSGLFISIRCNCFYPNESCSEFFRILVTTVHYTEQKPRISKTLYFIRHTSGSRYCKISFLWIWINLVIKKSNIYPGLSECRKQYCWIFHKIMANISVIKSIYSKVVSSFSHENLIYGLH